MSGIPNIGRDASDPSASGTAPLTYEHLHLLNSQSGWSGEARETTEWALAVVEEDLGSDWPTLLSGHGLAGFLQDSAHQLFARIKLIELAVALRLTRGVAGRAQLVKSLRTNLTAARMRHTLLQLEVAVLAARQDWTPTFELNTVDVTLERVGGPTMRVETFVVDQAEATRDALDQTRAIVDAQIMIYAVTRDVRLTGMLSQEPKREEIDGLRRALVQAINEVATDGRERDLDVGTGWIHLRRGIGQTGDSLSWKFDPRLDTRRLPSRVSQKVGQAGKSAATWLRIDLMDNQWQLADWWSAPLAVKALRIKAMVRPGLQPSHPFDGAVVTSGLLVGQGQFADQEITLVDGTIGLKRLVAPLRVRESVMIPLTEKGRSELLGWRDMYGAEQQWLPEALAELALPSLEKITRGRESHGIP